VDGLRHETMHNSGRCCGSGRTCYGAGRMSKALRTGVAFGLKVEPRQAQREKGSSPTLDVNGCCCSFVWVGRCVASQVPNWPGPTFVAIEHRVTTRLPFSANAFRTRPAGVRIVISIQKTVSIEQVFISVFIMAVHDFQNISKSVPGGRPSGTAPVAETGVVPAP